MSQFDAHPTAQLIADDAHAARNQLATLRAAADLLDDEAARADTLTALHALVRQHERLVVSARIDLDTASDRETHELDTLLQLAVRRARREGTASDELPACEGVTVVGPGSRIERLLVDLLHLRRVGGRFAVDDAQLRVEIDVPADPAELAWVTRLADATACRVEVEPGALVVSLPTR